jgi:transcriptional regulator with XRE-family HTH domain
MVHPTVNISEAMKAARERAGISQKELARRSGVAQANISRYEAGFCFPNLVSLLSLAEALGISVDEFIGLRRPR